MDQRTVAMTTWKRAVPAAGGGQTQQVVESDDVEPEAGP